MAEAPTFGELYNGKAILKADLLKAVDAYMADPGVTDFVMTGGFTLDLAAAVRASAHARWVLDDPGANMMRRRGVIRSAILLARPVKG